jgi:twitching motility protein PilI
MANREALRDLQSRLAGRLQAARSEGVSVAAWLAVQAGGRDYLLPLNQAGEIFPGPAFSPSHTHRPGFWASPICAVL